MISCMKLTFSDYLKLHNNGILNFLVFFFYFLFFNIFFFRVFVYKFKKKNHTSAISKTLSKFHTSCQCTECKSWIKLNVENVSLLIVKIHYAFWVNVKAVLTFLGEMIFVKSYFNYEGEEKGRGKVCVELMVMKR